MKCPECGEKWIDYVGCAKCKPTTDEADRAYARDHWMNVIGNDERNKIGTKRSGG